MTNAAPTATETEIVDHAARIRRNPLLLAIYEDVYRRILAEIPPATFPRCLEIGSGGGFFHTLAPHVITSECESVASVERTVDACRLTESFAPRSLDAICCFDVLHHLPDIRAFLTGAGTVLRTGGRIVAVEPWFTPLGQWYYRALHYEPWIADPDNWSLLGSGRLAGANSRLPTSVFRDSDARFAREFPDLRLVRRDPFHKWVYLLSGGLQLNTHIPRPIARMLLALDRTLRLGNATLGIFGLVVVERR